MALTAQAEFWDHVAELRADPASADRLAHRYVRRDQGRRRAAVRVYLERAAQAKESPDHRWEEDGGVVDRVARLVCRRLA